MSYYIITKDYASKNGTSLLGAPIDQIKNNNTIEKINVYLRGAIEKEKAKEAKWLSMANEKLKALGINIILKPEDLNNMAFLKAINLDYQKNIKMAKDGAIENINSIAEEFNKLVSGDKNFIEYNTLLERVADLINSNNETFLSIKDVKEIFKKGYKISPNGVSTITINNNEIELYRVLGVYGESLSKIRISNAKEIRTKIESQERWGRNKLQKYLLNNYHEEYGNFVKENFPGNVGRFTDSTVKLKSFLQSIGETEQRIKKALEDLIAERTKIYDEVDVKIEEKVKEIKAKAKDKTKLNISLDLDDSLVKGDITEWISLRASNFEGFGQDAGGAGIKTDAIVHINTNENNKDLNAKIGQLIQEINTNAKGRKGKFNAEEEAKLFLKSFEDVGFSDEDIRDYLGIDISTKMYSKGKNGELNIHGGSIGGDIETVMRNFNFLLGTAATLDENVGNIILNSAPELCYGGNDSVKPLLQYLAGVASIAMFSSSGIENLVDNSPSADMIRLFDFNMTYVPLSHVLSELLSKINSGAASETVNLSLNVALTSSFKKYIDENPPYAGSEKSMSKFYQENKNNVIIKLLIDFNLDNFYGMLNG